MIHSKLYNKRSATRCFYLPKETIEDNFSEFFLRARSGVEVKAMNKNGSIFYNLPSQISTTEYKIVFLITPERIYKSDLCALSFRRIKDSIFGYVLIDLHPKAYNIKEVGKPAQFTGQDGYSHVI